MSKTWGDIDDMMNMNHIHSEKNVIWNCVGY